MISRTKMAVVGHVGPASAETMSTPHALSALAALGQPTRLEVFRLLMRNEPAGLSAGAIAAAMACPQNTLSAHLSILARAGLVRGTREGRSIVYCASTESVRELIEFLVNDCCHGHPELCGLAGTGSKAACGCATAEAGPKSEA